MINKQSSEEQRSSLQPGAGPLSAEKELKLLFPEMSILSSVERLRLAGGSRIRGTMAGKRRSVSLGGSQEFADYRPYSAGDDIRRLDWNVYGRTGRAYVRQYWDEQELHAHIYMDATRSMAFLGGAEASKGQYALRLASLLGYAALNSDDRISVKHFDESGMTSELPSLHGRAAFMKLFRHMASHFLTEFNDINNLASDLSVPFRKPGALPRRSGVAWLFTDAMYERGVEETLIALTAAGQDIVFVHLLSPEEMNPSLSGELKLIDSELGTGKEVAFSEGLLKEYRKAVKQYQIVLKRMCAEKGAAYVFVDTSRPLLDVIQEMLLIPGVLTK